jgi:hypothetical protein
MDLVTKIKLGAKYERLIAPTTTPLNLIYSASGLFPIDLFTQGPEQNNYITHDNF